MSKLAKYQIVERAIRNAISDGTLKPGDRLMTEEELCARFGFSRTTVGKALDNLRADGYIERTAGRGTFVRTAHVEKQAGSSTSFTDDMASNDLEAGARLVSYQVLRARDAPEVAEHLQADENELIHHFIRLRTANGRPIAIGYTYIRSSVIPAIDIESLDGSFYSYVRSLGIEIRPAEQVRICAVLPTAEQLELLEANGIALLRSSHVNCAEKDGTTAHNPQATALPMRL